MKNLIGEKFGRWTVIDYGPKYFSPNGNSGNTWLCKCECGTIKAVQETSLLSGRSKSCGCLSRELTHNRSFMDLTGQIYGDLTVLFRAEDKVRYGKKRVTWHCICKCGNEVDVLAVDLRSGKVKSCGCKQYQIAGHNFIDLTGQTFNELYVIKRMPNRQKSGGNIVTRWLCRCSCGSEIIVDGDSLRTGHTKSCGCILSFGEKEICKILTSYNIVYKRNYIFNDCLSSKKFPLMYDFALFDTDNNLLCLIEYQGKQHYQTDEEAGNFGKLQRDETDQTKKEYCYNHSFDLYEIKYNENIENKLKEILNIVYGNTVPSKQEIV